MFYDAHLRTIAHDREMLFSGSSPVGPAISRNGLGIEGCAPMPCVASAPAVLGNWTSASGGSSVITI